MMLFTKLVVSFFRVGGVSVNYIIINANPSISTEQHDQCGKQYHGRELLMMVIVMLETC